MEGSGRLDSWKAIATYLNRDIRTVQRWERAEGLPVHRHQHAERGSVYAFTSEIDGWQAARRNVEAPPARTHGRLRMAIAAGLAIVLMVAMTAWIVRRTAQATVATAESEFDPPRILDTILREGTAPAAFPLGPGSYSLAASPDGRRVFVAGGAANGLQVVNADTGRVERTFPLRSPASTVIVSDGRRIYLGLQTGGIVVLDSSTWTLREIPEIPHPRDMVLTKDGTRLYLAAEYAGLLEVDTSSFSVRQMSTVMCPAAVALSPDDGLLYVDYQCGRPGGRPDVLDVIDTHTGQVVDTIGGFPNVGNEIAVTVDGGELWLDGHNVCAAPEYDHTGCPVVPGRIVHVVRASDHRLLKALGAPLSAVGYRAARLEAVPSGHRIATVTPDVGISVHDTMTLNLVETADLPVESNIAFDAAVARAFVVIGGELRVLALERRRRAPAGLAAQWTGDGTANDSIRDSHLQGAPRAAYSPGRIGAAFAFDGASSLWGRPMNIAPVSLPFSVMAWVKFAAAGTASPMALVAVHEPESQQPIRAWTLMRDAEQRLAWCAGGSAAGCDGAAILVNGRTPLVADRWYHVAVTRSETAVAVYVNGALDGDRPIDMPSPVSWHHSTLRLGAADGGSAPLRGLLDEVEIYERALTPAEVAARASR